MTQPTVSRVTRGPAPPPLRLEGPVRRRRPSRLRRGLSTLLILAGLALGADVGLTLVWQEPVTAVIAVVRRGDIDQRWARGIPLGPVARAELTSIHGMDARVAFLAAREDRTAPDGAALGTLSIPEIGVRYQLIQGATSSSLQLGPGHYDQTDLPGQGGTVAIAGHRTTYLAPFHNLNELKPGDPITLSMPYGVFSYVVQHVQIVAPDAWWITADEGYDRLVLSSCNPLFSAAQRIVVFARLAGVTPAALVRAPAAAARSLPDTDPDSGPDSGPDSDSDPATPNAPSSATQD
jgi:sortase A